MHSTDPDILINPVDFDPWLHLTGFGIQLIRLGLACPERDSRGTSVSTSHFDSLFLSELLAYMYASPGRNHSSETELTKTSQESESAISR